MTDTHVWVSVCLALRVWAWVVWRSASSCLGYFHMLINNSAEQTIKVGVTHAHMDDNTQTHTPNGLHTLCSPIHITAFLTMFVTCN